MFNFTRTLLLWFITFSTGTLALAEAPCTTCSTLDYGKKIELNLLKPMIKMSIAEKIRYIQSFGLDLYKVEDPEKDTPTVGFLPLAPQQDFSRYIKLFSEGVIGIYMTPNNTMYGVKKPTILFVESADDWTIVHEFSHYLFDRARTSQGAQNEGVLLNNASDAQEDYFEAREKFRISNSYVDEAHKKHTISSFINFAQVQMIFIKSCDFEETTIEKLLRNVFKSQNPVGFRESDFERSTRYIRNTSKTGQQSLDILLQDCASLPATLNDSDVELKSALAKTCENVRHLKDANEKVLRGLHIQLSP